MASYFGWVGMVFIWACIILKVSIHWTESTLKLNDSWYVDFMKEFFWMNMGMASSKDAYVNITS